MTLVTFFACFALVGVTRAQSCAPTSTAQDVADFGPTAIGPGRHDVAESSIAIGADRVLMVDLVQATNQFGFTTERCRYSVRSDVEGSGGWTARWAPPPPAGMTGQWDPTAVYDVQNGDFLIAVVHKNYGNTQFRLDVTRYHPGTDTIDPVWTEVASASSSVGGLALDRPFLLAGAPDEFYAFWWNRNASDYEYRRTTHGGHQTSDWQGGVVADGVTGLPIRAGAGFLQGSTCAGAPLYFTYYASADALGFLEGRDCGAVACFTVLRDAAGNPLRIPLRSGGGAVDPILPGGFVAPEIPAIAADPTDRDRFWVAYSDADALHPRNVDVYAAKVERAGSAWRTSAPFLVDDDPPPPAGCGEPNPHTDQFSPSLVVDTRGRLHCVYYDDRNYCQSDEAPTGRVAFDLTYALSCNGGATFYRQTFRSLVAGEGFMDFRSDPADTFGPRDYNGMAFRDRGGHLTVWCSNFGMDSADPDDQKNVVYGVRIIL